MMTTQDCNNCKRKCDDHSGCTADIRSNTLKIAELDETTTDLVKDVATLQGRLNILITIASILLTTLISISTYSVFQLTSFKNEYQKDKQTAIERSFVQEKAYIELLNKLGERVTSLERNERLDIHK